MSEKVKKYADNYKNQNFEWNPLSKYSTLKVLIQTTQTDSFPILYLTFYKFCFQSNTTADLTTLSKCKS